MYTYIRTYSYSTYICTNAQQRPVNRWRAQRWRSAIFSCPTLCVALCRVVYMSHVTSSNESCHTRMRRDNVLSHTLIERNPPPWGGFLFTMFPDQEPCVRDFTTRAMSHVTQEYGAMMSCPTLCVVLCIHVEIGYVTHVTEGAQDWGCHKYKCGMSHKWVSHMPIVSESYHTYSCHMWGGFDS